MPVATIEVYFLNPAVTQVVVVQYRRKKVKKIPAKWKGNPHRQVRWKVAVLTDPTQLPSEENPWTTKFGLSSVDPNDKTIFQAIGLDAQGNVIVSFTKPA